MRAEPIPTQYGELNTQQREHLDHLRDVLKQAQDLGDLYTEWYAAQTLTALLWQEVGRYGADCCTTPTGETIYMNALLS